MKKKNVINLGVGGLTVRCRNVIASPVRGKL